MVGFRVSDSGGWSTSGPEAFGCSVASRPRTHHSQPLVLSHPTSAKLGGSTEFGIWAPSEVHQSSIREFTKEGTPI